MANNCKSCRFVKISRFPDRNNNHAVVCRALGWLITNPGYDNPTADCIETPEWCPVQKQIDGTSDSCDVLAMAIADLQLGKEASDGNR